MHLAFFSRKAQLFSNYFTSFMENLHSFLSYLSFIFRFLLYIIAKQTVLSIRKSKMDVLFLVNYLLFIYSVL
jgi:hypothetical protein